MNNQPLVTVVVLNWNGEKIFPACIESLLQSDFPSMEILFVDNGSSDNSIAIARRYKNLSILENNKNLGYAAGNNRALKFMNGKYVCFLNNDIIVDPGWLNSAIPFFETNESIGAIACRNMDYFDRDKIDGLYHYIVPFFDLVRFGRGEKYRADPLYSQPGYVLSALGCSAIYRTALFKKLGGFDESFFAYWEDADLCMRINNSGYRCLYVPASVVYHMDQGSFGRNSKTSVYFSERNKYLFIKKNFPRSFLIRLLKKIILEDLRAFKNRFLENNHFWIFCKAKMVSLYLLSHYRFSSNKACFNEDYISQLFKKAKIPL